MKSHFFEISFLDILISTSSHTKLDDRNEEKKNTQPCRKVMNENYKSYTSPLKWNSSLCSFWIELLLFYFRLHSSIIFSCFERFILYLKKKKHREGERENHGWCHSIYKEFCRSIRMFLNYSFYIYLVCLSEQCSNHDCNRRTSYFVCGKSFYSKRNFVNIFFHRFWIMQPKIVFQFYHQVV